MSYDVIIIGAGVTGAFTARELSKYRLRVCLLEKEGDIAAGASKANSGIVHAGYDPQPGTLKAGLNLKGAGMMSRVAEELDVPFRNNGSLVLAFTPEEYHVLTGLMDRGIANGVEGLALLDARQVRGMEPGVSENAVAALYAPSAGIICPYELTAGAVENAVANGVELKLDCEVTGIFYREGLFSVAAGGETLTGRYLVNAAGINADLVCAMAGDGSFGIIPGKGEYLLLDKNQGGIVEKVIFQCPTEKGKGILVTPTVDGNLLIGPTAEQVPDRGDTATTGRGLSMVVQGALKSVPGMDVSQVITSFAGLRAKSSAGDFIIGASEANRRFINAAGIDSPGLTSAPAIGELVAELLGEQGLLLAAKDDFDPRRKRVARFRDRTGPQIEELIKSDARYGRLVCRCEKVTEAEVVDCIRRPGGARSLDAVKRRTRAGMGRCQGGFCSPRIVEILSRELGIPMDKVTKSGGGSYILAGGEKDSAGGLDGAGMGGGIEKD